MDEPNVVVICCDDLGYGDLGCYGAEYETPNIDALAADGVRFTDWHSNAPVCSPTRASLLTGRYPQRAGVPGNCPSQRPETDPGIGLPPEETTIADALSEAGYRTGAFGKWHLGMTERDDAVAHGFDEFFGFRSGCVDYYSHLFMWRQHDDVPPYHDLWADRDEVWHNGEYLTELITDRAVEFIEDTGEPFFEYVAYNAPHYPMHAPEEYFDRFSHLEDEERRTQAAMVAGIDDGVGEIRAALEAAGVAEETLVVFTSDHGPSREIRNHLDGSETPYRGGRTGGFRGHKFSLYEGGIRVPGIINAPDGTGGHDSDALAATMDVLPTVLDYCGVDRPDAHIDGESLRETLSGDAPSPHERMYWAAGDQLALRDRDWKLVLSGNDIDADETPSVHLADLESDPAESENVADRRPDLTNELTADVRAWHDRVTEASN